MILMLLFGVAYLAFMAGYEAGWYVARGPEEKE